MEFEEKPDLTRFSYQHLSRPGPAVDCMIRPDGVQILTNPSQRLKRLSNVALHLYEKADKFGDRVFMAERNAADDGWDRVSYSQMLDRVRRVAQWMIEQGLGQDRRVAILSRNSLNHAYVTFAGQLAGVPLVPVSPGYSLISKDFSKLKHCIGLTQPEMIYVEDLAPFKPALGALDWPMDQVIVGAPAEEDKAVHSVPRILRTVATDAVERRRDTLRPDMLAKILFTSGSTAMPKAVPNTIGNIAAAAAMVEHTRPCPESEHRIVLDWLPWHHTYGGNVNTNVALMQGRTYYIDSGSPLPENFPRTIRNLIEVRPTEYSTVPAALAALVEAANEDPELARAFFSRVSSIGCGGSALPQEVLDRLQALAIRMTGQKLHVTTGIGMTETVGICCTIHWENPIMGSVGLPNVGSEVKLVPQGEEFELWVRGPQVMPGYWQPFGFNREDFDEEGFFNTGDLVVWSDPDDPLKGLEFRGRHAENFKLTNGSWVAAGELRTRLVSELSPFVSDAVITGRDKSFVGALIWLQPAAVRAAFDPDGAAELDKVYRSDTFHAALRERLGSFNAGQRGATRTIRALRVLTAPPDADAGEVTDKRSINQRIATQRRASDIAKIYGETVDDLTVRI